MKITFEMLDTGRVGVVAFLWRQNPFTEYQMTNVSGNIYTYTITGQTIGSPINYAVKFAYAGGLSVTKYFSYVVGTNCNLDTNSYSQKQLFYPNPIEDVLNFDLSEAENVVEIKDGFGKQLIKMVVGSSHQLDVSDLKTGIYFLQIKNANGTQNSKILKK